MFLIQLLIPLNDNSGHRFPKSKLKSVKTSLIREFGGLTMYQRSPAEGLIKECSGLVKDEIIIFEVMSSKIKKSWWRRYRSNLEKEFRQDSIIVRASKTDLL